jgi:hypothetical protein
MTRREELEAMSQEELDDLVHSAKMDEASHQEGADDDIYDAKGDEAATINNQGRDAQIDYLLS